MAMERSGHGPDWGLPAPPIVNETKLQIISMMGVVGDPISAEELWGLWGGRKPQAVFDYHLCTLVKAEVARFVSGRELRFALTGQASSALFSTTYRGVVPPALAEEKRN